MSSFILPLDTVEGWMVVERCQRAYAEAIDADDLEVVEAQSGERLARVEGAVAALAGQQLVPQLTAEIRRIADHLAPPADDRPVGTPYVANKIGCTTRWVCELARKGTIPADCIAKSGGDGGYWMFHRAQIDAWFDHLTCTGPARPKVVDSPVAWPCARSESTKTA